VIGAFTYIQRDETRSCTVQFWSSTYSIAFTDPISNAQTIRPSKLCKFTLRSFIRGKKTRSSSRIWSKCFQRCQGLGNCKCQSIGSSNFFRGRETNGWATTIINRQNPRIQADLQLGTGLLLPKGSGAGVWDTCILMAECRLVVSIHSEQRSRRETNSTYSGDVGALWPGNESPMDE
jgi:hypothetical protein